MGKCCQCQTYRWKDDQGLEIVYHAGGFDYCVFHAPIDEKRKLGTNEKYSVAEFNKLVFDRINDVIALVATEDNDFTCNLGGTVFPGEVSFAHYNVDNPLPSINFLDVTFNGKSEFFGVRFDGNVDFSRATFLGETDFAGARFRNKVSFTNSMFKGNLNFSDAVFNSEVTFSGAAFQGNGSFFNATKFKEKTIFVNTTFDGKLRCIDAVFSMESLFNEAKFNDDACFHEARFGKQVDFRSIQLRGEADFYLSKFNGKAIFRESLFTGAADFSLAIFADDADFSKTRFREVARFVGACFKQAGEFSNSEFSREVDFENSSWMDTSFAQARFGDVVRFLWAEFSQPTDFSGIHANESAVQLHQLSELSLNNLLFHEREIDYFSFKGCRSWPYTLKLESAPYHDYKACEALFRLLKRTAEEEKNMQMVSDWHFKEKLMKLKKMLTQGKNGLALDLAETPTNQLTAQGKCIAALDVIENNEARLCSRVMAWFALFWWSFSTPLIKLRLTGLYWFSSGFGEKPVRAFWVLVAMCFLVIAINLIQTPQWVQHLEADALVNAIMTFVPFTKDIKGDGWLKIGQALWQGVILLQFTLFALAVRNRFRR